jgi:hypothetical protein
MSFQPMSLKDDRSDGERPGSSGKPALGFEGFAALQASGQEAVAAFFVGEFVTVAGTAGIAHRRRFRR